MDAESTVPHVVVVGGGFAGLNAAKALAGKPVRVTLVDRKNHHLFQPLLYQVATASLSPADISTPIRAIFRKHENITTLLAEVAGIDLERREVILTDGRLPYDSLIVATGASHAYFGHDEWTSLAPGLKSLEDALEIRRRIFLAFESAEREPDPERRRQMLTFVVVGGGPTGVELAGALGEIAHGALRRDFRSINPDQTRILLVDAGPRILATYSPKLSAAAARQLGMLGVTVRTDAAVASVEPDAVVLRSGERIPTGTILWAAGVRASSLGRALGVPLDSSGRVKVAPDLSLPDHPEVFVAGDLAYVPGPRGKPLPGLSPVAMQQGKHAGKMILADLAGKPRRPFRYFDKGTMATIGRNKAVAAIRRLEFSGFPAWLAWGVVHIFFLIGFRNRAIVMLEWIWLYLTRRRSARLITAQPPRPGRQAVTARAGAGDD